MTILLWRPNLAAVFRVIVFSGFCSGLFLPSLKQYWCQKMRKKQGPERIDIFKKWEICQGPRNQATWVKTIHPG
jgi:hypothetical protein